MVQDEVAVRAVGEHARLEHEASGRAIGEIPPGKGAEQLLVLRLGLAVHRVGIHLLAPMVILPNLKPGMRKLGKP